MAVAALYRVEPSQHLRPWISEIRVGTSSPGQTYRLTRLPGGETGLLFRATEEGTGELFVSGPLRRARFKITKTIPFFVRVSLRPGQARQALGYPLHELADRIVPLENICSSIGKSLCAQLMEGGPDRAVALIEDALSKVIFRQNPKSVSLVSQIVRAMDEDTGAAVEDYANLAGLSPRQLRRLFLLELGISPKRYIRIARLKRLLATPRAKVQWAHAAIEAGFYDQAHLIADFKDLLNTTPEAFLTARSEYTTCH